MVHWVAKELLAEITYLGTNLCYATQLWLVYVRKARGGEGTNSNKLVF
jgi:hypothetical protein